MSALSDCDDDLNKVSTYTAQRYSTTDGFKRGFIKYYRYNCYQYHCYEYVNILSGQKLDS